MTGSSREVQSSRPGEAEPADRLGTSMKQEERGGDMDPEQPHTPQQQQPARDKGRSAEPDPHLTALIGRVFLHGPCTCIKVMTWLIRAVSCILNTLRLANSIMVATARAALAES